MVISPKQMDAFSASARENFIARMVTHLKKCFPAQCGMAGDGKIRESVELGMERAGRYGFTTERNVCKYTDLMYTLGPGFDEDPALPWAAEVLQRDAYWDENMRMEKLIDASLKYLKERDSAPKGR